MTFFLGLEGALFAARSHYDNENEIDLQILLMEDANQDRGRPMTKYLLGAIVGVFAAAFIVELMSRKDGGIVKKVRGKATGAARDFRTAFAEGYRGQMPEPDPPVTH